VNEVNPDKGSEGRPRSNATPLDGRRKAVYGTGRGLCPGEPSDFAILAAAGRGDDPPAVTTPPPCNTHPLPLIWFPPRTERTRSRGVGRVSWSARRGLLRL
jgi:hypothetical protein